MANHRALSESLRKVSLCRIEVLGAAGIPAVTPSRLDGLGVLTSAGAGVYTIPLLRRCKDTTKFSVDILQAAAYNATLARFGRIVTDSSATATPSITFVITNSAGTPIQPATGDKMWINIEVTR